jgi:hypothetical protein
MVKLTVIYNLPPGADHEEFLKWRTTEHQQENVSMPGLVKTDFYIVKSGWPQKGTSYRYITEAYFPDMETFEKSFFAPDYQVRLAESLKRIADPLFLISEEVITQVAG